MKNTLKKLKLINHAKRNIPIEMNNRKFHTQNTTTLCKYIFLTDIQFLCFLHSMLYSIINTYHNPIDITNRHNKHAKHRPSLQG